MDFGDKILEICYFVISDTFVQRYTVAGEFFNTVNLTFYLSFDLTSFFRIASLKVIKKKFFN